MPELIIDELVGENFTAQSNSVLQLDGALSQFFTFASAMRADGVTPAQPGDMFPVTATADPSYVVSCLAAFTPGDPAFLTLDVGNMYRSSGGANLPNFSGRTGRVKLALNASLLFLQNLAGGLTNPKPLRETLSPTDVTNIAAELGRLSGEAFWPAGLTGINDLLAGAFAWSSSETDSADGKDVIDSLSAGYKIVRQSIKIGRTFRGKTIADGVFLSMLDAADPLTEWILHYRSQDGAHRGFALVSGHASDPHVDVLRQYGSAPFELSGTGVGLRNQSGGALTFDYTPVLLS